MFLDLLSPLKHPSDLPNHPSMAHAYTSKSLRLIVEGVEARLRHESALLWKAKKLHREFLGDASWMPCGFLETIEDRNIFEPNCGFGGPSSSKSPNGHSHSSSSSRSGSAKLGRAPVHGGNQTGASDNLQLHSQNSIPTAPQPDGQDAEM